MKIAVVGGGHLAEATRTALGGAAPLIEDAALVWFCVDTPVDGHDRPDVPYVKSLLAQTVSFVRSGTPILISSQVPVGFCAEVEGIHCDHHFAIQPENIRKAHALEDFRQQARMIVGTRHLEDRAPITKALRPFTNEILFMSPESAEMVKHTLNCFLAMEIAFANEMADVCRSVGADVGDVFGGFRSDRRVGDGPLWPGDPYRGGTLGRDVGVLCEHSPLVAAVRASNTARL
jgi:UDPglucose 6-dehydrogenase